MRMALSPLPYALDAWQHSCYLDYQHHRRAYIAAFVAHSAIWDFVKRNLVEALPHGAESADAR